MDYIYTTTQYQLFDTKVRQIACTSDLSRVALLYEPTEDELLCAISEYEEARLSVFWDEMIIKEHPNGGIIRGFADRHRTTCDYFNSAAIAKIAGVPSIYSKNLRANLTLLRNKPLAKQRRLVETRIGKPKSFAEARQFMPSYKKQMFSFCLSTKLQESKSYQHFVESLLTFACNSTRLHQESWPVRRVEEFLLMLHQRQWILFPLSLLQSKIYMYRSGGLLKHEKGQNFFTRFDFLLPQEMTALFDEVSVWLLNERGIISPGWGLMVRSGLRDFFLCTNVRAITDVVPELVYAFYTLKRKHAEGRRGEVGDGRYKQEVGVATAVFKGLCTLWKVNNPEEVFSLDAKINEYDRYFGTQLEKEPLLQPWIELICLYLDETRLENVAGVAHKLKSLILYLLELPDFPSTPLLATRDALRGFAEFLANCNVTNRTRNIRLSEASRFFKWCRNKYKAPDENPIDYEVDRFSETRESKSITHRIALRPRVIRLMRETLTANDYAWPRTLRSDYATVFDRTRGEQVRAWFPGRAVIMETMLVFPIRSMGARLLDSGEADEQIYDHEHHQMIMNPDPKAVSGRQEGVLRLKPCIPKAILSFHVPAHKMHSSYDIDYVPEEQAAHLQMMLDWQKRYGPPFEVITLGDDPRAYEKNRDPKVKLKMTRIVPLFRDSTRPLGQQKFPVTEGRMYNFFQKLCVETEKRHPELKLTKEVIWKGRKERVSIFDKHTLRVSLNTGLINQGGLHLSQARQLLNHTTLLMTLYYNHPSATDMHQALRIAYERMEEAGLDADKFAEEYDQHRNRFISNSNDAHEAFNHNRNNRGLWTVGESGICPGTSCAEGGHLLDSSHGIYAPVPGARCALCRFFLTGPSFLIGLTVEANNLMWHMKNKAEKLQGLFDKRIEFEASQRKREFSQVDNTIDRLDEEMDLDWQEWQALTNFIQASSSLLSDETVKENDNEEAKLSLITHSSISDLKASLTECSYFELLHSITNAAEVIPDFPKAQNDGAVMEKHELLNTLLSVNGLEPFLIRLPKHLKLKAGNLLSLMMIKHVPQSSIDSLVSGDTPLRTYPGLEAKIESLRNQLTLLSASPPAEELGE